VVHESHRLRYVMQFVLRPQRSGRLVVPELDVGDNGRTLTTPSLALDVVAPRPSLVSELVLNVTPPRPYVEQTVTFELEVRVRAFEFAGTWISEGDPWTRAAPQLTIPWFRELDGFETGEFAPWAQELLKGGEGGVSINNLRDSSFFSSGLLTFHLPAETIERDGVPWRVYRLRKTLRPLNAGTIEVPISSLRGTFITRAEGRSRPETVAADEKVFVAHDPRRIEVRAIPKEGRPATYRRAVGRFRVESSIAPARVNVGDPVTLSVRVWGEGRLDSLLPPALDRQDSLTRDFVVAESSTPSDYDGTSKVFAFTIRPREARITKVPPIELAYFDPETETFEVVRSIAQNIEVESSTSVGAGGHGRDHGDREQAQALGDRGLRAGASGPVQRPAGRHLRRSRDLFVLSGQESRRDGRCRRRRDQ
jgi:hypothetical protein